MGVVKEFMVKDKKIKINKAGNKFSINGVPIKKEFKSVDEACRAVEVFLFGKVRG